MKAKQDSKLVSTIKTLNTCILVLDVMIVTLYIVKWFKQSKSKKTVGVNYENQ